MKPATPVMKSRIPLPLRWLLLPVVLLLLAFPLYLLVLFLLVMLPPLLTVLSWSQADAEGKRPDVRTVLLRLFFAWIALPLGMLGLIAPLRGLMLTVTALFPALQPYFDDLHEPLYVALQSLLGPLAVWQADLWLGIYGVLAMLVFFILHAMRRNMLARHIRSMPTSRARSVAMGMAELAGKAVAMPGTPHDVPIIRSWLEQRGNKHSHRTERHPFYLTDGTDMILVDPRGASVDSTLDMFFMNLHQVKLRRVTGENDLPETRLMAGEQVFLVGSVELNTDPATREHDPVVVRPRKSDLFGIQYFDIFFLTNLNEKEALAAMDGGVVRNWLEIALLIANTAWMSVNAFNNVAQLESMNPEATPSIIRQLAQVGVLEQPLPLTADGATTLHQVLQTLQGRNADIEAEMAALENAHLANYAIPALRERLQDIDHPGFGQAIHWLARLNAFPPGLMAFENGTAGDDETLIHRIVLRRERSGIVASWRAHFNLGQPINEHVVARTISVSLEAVQGGKTWNATFPAQPGWNRADNLTLFKDLPPGKYLISFSVRREFDEGPFGRYDTGSRPISTIKVKF